MYNEHERMMSLQPTVYRSQKRMHTRSVEREACSVQDDRRLNAQSCAPPRGQSPRGIAIILVLVFAGVFALSVAGLVNFILLQSQLGGAKLVREQALGVAEAGLAYYAWFLAHNPGDLTNGTGAPGPYTRTYSDPEIGTIGSYRLDISGNFACGQLQSTDITSTGTIDAQPEFTRTVFGRHAAPSVAEYAYIIGANVWAGADREITGPYHSNGGVRMDGTNNSTVTSGVASWSASFDCNESGAADGVCGDGPNTQLWEYPRPTVDFDAMATDFADMKTFAQQEGIYLAPYGSATINYYGTQTAVNGYRLRFNSDGTVDIYQVTNTAGYWGQRSGIGWTPDFHVITGESFIERRAIPEECPLIFVEDKVWIEGVVNGKVTVVAADLVNPGYDPDVILRDDIDYSTLDGSDGLTVISEFGIYIPPQSPNNLLLRGIFVAQGDRFGRPGYQNDVRDQLTMHGAIVSRERVGTAWRNSEGTVISGYRNRDNFFDRLQTTNPPPFTPTSTTTPRYILWREQ